MQLNKDRLWKLLDATAEKLNDRQKQKKTEGYRELARQLGVAPAQLHRTLNSDSQAGPVLLGKIRDYCKENGLDFDEFLL